MGRHDPPRTGDGKTRGKKIGKAEFDVKRASGSSIPGEATRWWHGLLKKGITGKVTRKD